ncbi:alpha-amylase family glycosyl hydrolase [Chitiniphilus purpureus]|uniref:Alpha-amylase family glycosyl hydrolase n=1 Tax=Chitiniphilus purpureus TaxID=2981137 RepID=A0ABY6DJV4_9NEIS|nr:alpha-amylase family glycosyl hydrolase [Chitiniphilus sp. CD1]UXY14644.1 alpha-amylase family glycosyl hydrolase [Chitiniphilus sp. CD1]
MVEHMWWQRGVIYQVYPRSFMDGNGDGVGDLTGLRERLDYLAWLGVDALWITPIQPSPMLDFGYDITDYADIDPLFGDLAAFDDLIAAAHARGIRIILDFVPNHTSDRHPWFIDACSSRKSAKRDWYVWQDPLPDGGPPNNWRSHFGGLAWEMHQPTGQYYLRTFLPQQPDLNWRNPAVQAAMHQVMRFWLDRGVDGLRLDAIWHLIKDEQLRNNPPNPGWQDNQPEHERLLHVFTSDRPEMQGLLRSMRKVVDAYPERVLIAELYLSTERTVSYYGREGDGVHLPANTALLGTPWNAESMAAAIDQYEAALPTHGWPNWSLGNHDQPRVASRVPAGQERLAAMLLLTLRGTPLLYYGDEIGMRNVPIPPERLQDPIEKNMPGLGRGRDPQRTPMQWDHSANAGFSQGEPWLPLAEDAAQVNVASQRDDPASVLQLYRRLIQLRREHPALAVGSYRGLAAPLGALVFEREHEGRQIRVALNFSDRPCSIAMPPGEMLLESTAGATVRTAESGTLQLAGGAGVIVAL